MGKTIPVLLYCMHGNSTENGLLCNLGTMIWEPKGAKVDQEFINEVKCQVNFISCLNQLPVLLTIQ